MASERRFQGNSEGLKVLKKAVKSSSFVIFVTNERSVGRNSSEIERANKCSKSMEIQQFRQGWVGERCEIHKLLGDSGEPEIVRKGVIYSVFVKKKARCSQRGLRSAQPKRLSIG